MNMHSRLMRAALVGSYAAGCHQPPHNVSELVLLQESVVNLPTGFDAAGVAANEKMIVAWDGAEARLALVDSRGIRIVDAPANRPFRKIWWNQLRETWQGMVEEPVRIIELTEDWLFGDVTFSEITDGGGTIIDATAHGDTLWLLRRTRDQALTISEHVGKSGARLAFSMSYHRANLPDTAARPIAHLARGKGGLGANLLWRSFDAYIVTPRGLSRANLLRQLRASEGLSHELRRSLTVDPWAALPLVPLDTGWVVTVAELRGDTRVLARLRPDGALAAARPIDVPVGVAASSPASRKLVLVKRQMLGTTIYVYSWKWARAGATDTMWSERTGL